MSLQCVTRLSPSSLQDATRTETSATDLLSGDGTVSTFLGFASSDGSTVSGVWSSEAFSKKKSHPQEMEFCYIIEGEVKLTDTQGNSETFTAGDALVVTPGFDGEWQSLTTVKKYFVISKCQ